MKIIDLFEFDTEHLDRNIFYYIFVNKPTDTLEWLTSDNFNTFDLEYYLSHSGDKQTSLLFDRLMERNNNDTASVLDKIAKVLINKFQKNWDVLHDALFSEYNPIENYSMVEHESVNTNMNTTNKSKQNTFGLGTTAEDGSPSQKLDGSVDTTGEAKDNYRDLIRSGNIGTTTSQMMVQSEVELRTLRNNFNNIIFDDIDSVLTTCLY